MLTDLTENFELAKSQQSSWTKSHFKKFLGRVPTVLNSKLDWDEGSGENWAVFLNDETVALISVIIPLAFVCSGQCQDLEQMCRDLGIVVISVDDFDEERFSLKNGKIFEIFGVEETDIGNSAEPISVNDIWFHTV